MTKSLAQMQYKRGYSDAAAGHSPSLLRGPYMKGFSDQRSGRAATVPVKGESVSTDSTRFAGPYLEDLASLEHKSWSDWATYMLDTLSREAQEAGVDVERLQGLQCFKRWHRQRQTPYKELSESEKESDRREVRKRYSLYRDAVISRL